MDCNAAPNHYAESSEQLQRAQRLRQQSQKLRHVVQSELGFGTSGEIFFRNDARTAESNQKPTVRLPQGRSFRAPNSKLNKRMDNNNAAAVDSTADASRDDATKQKANLDASEVLYSRRNSRKKEREQQPVPTGDGKEIQETAETSNFGNKGYSYPAPEPGYQYLPPQQAYNYPTAKESLKASSSSNGKTEKLKNNSGFLNEPQPFTTRPTERPTEIYASTLASLEETTIKPIIKKQNKVGKSLEQQITTTAKPQTKSTAAATSVTRQRGSTTYASSLKAEKDSVRSRVQSSSSSANSLVNGNNLKSSTPSYDSQKINTYTTARKPNGGKTKETPFYTPTIPTIRDTPTITTAALSTTTPASSTTTTTTTTIAPETSTKPTNSEIVKHALEMMESLKELDMDDVIPTEAERYMGQRLGLEVPPSSGPNALHSLALYFANGDTNNTKRMTQIANGISSVFLSNQTIKSYEQLFPSERKSTESPVTRRPVSTTTSNYQSDLENDLETQHSKNPILSAAGTPQLREIAQVFTHALSAYLQDPEQFRKILSEIRPTEPPNVQFNEIPRFPGEKGFIRQESAYNVARQTSQKSEDLEIFEYSDVTVPSRVQATEEETTTEFIDDLSTTEASFITTTYYPQVTETLPPASSKLADKTPASRLLSENLERAANSRVAKQFDEKLRLPAGEINRNLDTFTTRYDFYERNKSDNDDGDDVSYFPENRGNKSILAPYGFGVKPENSTPINDPYPTSLTDTQAVPLRWGEELTTIDPLTEFNVYPTVFSDLLPPYDINGSEVFSIPNVPSNGLELPNEETDEHLQHAQSQSFVASRNSNNNIFSNEEKKTKSYNVDIKNEEEILLGTTNFGERITTEIPQTTTQQKIRGHFVTKAVPSTSTTTDAPETTTFDYTTTENYKTTLPDTGIINTDSKTTVSYTVFLDPLTINDGLMESIEVTPSPNTYLPRNELSSTEEIIEQQQTTQTTTHRRGKSSFATTPLTIRFNDDEEHQQNSIEIEPMQKRANHMFGNLNETQVNHLMNVMKKADENKTVRRLILLLIQTCDGDDHNKTLEASRTALLNALIGMDNAEERNEIRIVNNNNRREKSVRTTTLPSVPITTYKSPEHERYTSSETVSKELEDSEATVLPFEQTTTYYGQSSNVNEYTTQDYHYSTTDQEAITTTDIPSTTTQSTTTTTTTTIKSEPIESSRLTNSKPRFRLKSSNVRTQVSSELSSIRHQKSLGTNEEYQAEASSTLENKKADARALELLRSLYSLASRWGKK